MIYGLRRMIYLLRKHDIISVPSYEVGIYHPPKVGIISKIYHPFREERISLKTPSLYHNEGVFMSMGYKKDIFAGFAYEFEPSQFLHKNIPLVTS